ncbi:MAG: hypothetical protein R3B99_18485 [Polyangiales bacterium]
MNGIESVLSELQRFAEAATANPKLDEMEAAVRELWRRHRVDEMRRTLRVALETSGAKLPSADFEAIACGRVDTSDRSYAVAKAFLEGSENFLILGGDYGVGKSFGTLAAIAELVVKPRVRQWAADVEAKIGLGGFDLARTPAENLALIAPPDASSRVLPLGFAWWLGGSLSSTWEPWRDERARGAKPGNRNAPVLVVDDLASEPESDRETAALEQLVEHRLGLRTILTTNASPTQLRARYGLRAGDRIGHLGRRVHVEGPSRRRGSAW